MILVDDGKIVGAREVHFMSEGLFKRDRMGWTVWIDGGWTVDGAGEGI